MRASVRVLLRMKCAPVAVIPGRCRARLLGTDFAFVLVHPNTSNTQEHNMTSSSRTLLAAVFAAVVFVPNALAQGGNGRLIAYLNSLPTEAISPVEHASLIQMRQEEKLARDVYEVLFFVWQQPIYSNIANSEQGHMDLVGRMLTKYNIPDPITNDAWGQYQDPVFTQLFVQLVQFGMRSPLHAWITGAYIEDFDISDLNATIQTTDNRDLNTVWQNLNRGSRNHMRSFYGQLSGVGLVYPGFVISFAEIQAIVNAPYENQPVDENGNILP
tara:strand:- start:1549 stop:2361 length:813 start_codon:yes stop_codon:yes gene_type:complete